MNVLFVRFCIAALAWIVIASTWPAAAWYELGECGRLWPDLKHEITYTIIHFVAFPFAVGWVAVYAPSLVKTRRSKEWAYRALLLAMFALMIWVSIGDLTSGYLLTRDLRCPCSSKFAMQDQSRSNAQQMLQQKSEELARAQAMPSTDASTLIKLRKARDDLKIAYNDPTNEYLSERRKTGIVATLRQSNLLVPASSLITITFQCFCAFVVWCVVLHICDARDVDRSVLRFRAAWLATTIVVLCAWIPARAYANFWTRTYGMVPCSDRAVIFAGSFALLVLFFMCLNQVIIDWKSWEILKYLAGLACGLMGFAVTKFPSLGEQIKAICDELSFSMQLTIGLSFTLFVALVARNAIERNAAAAAMPK